MRFFIKKLPIAAVEYVFSALTDRMNSDFEKIFMYYVSMNKSSINSRFSIAWKYGKIEYKENSTSLNKTLKLMASKEILECMKEAEDLNDIIRPVHLCMQYRKETSEITHNKDMKDRDVFVSHPVYLIHLVDTGKFFDVLSPDTVVTLHSSVPYNLLLKLVKNYEQENKKIRLFDFGDSVFEGYKDIPLGSYNLSKINFDGKNLSHLNISENIGNVTINIDKIQKDLRASNFNGYNLAGTTLREFNLIDADLRNTGVGVDLATCNYSLPGKLGLGTLFDEGNVFFQGDKKLSIEDVKSMGIKIYKKCR